MSTEDLVADCIAVLDEPDPRGAVRDVLERFVTGTDGVGLRDRAAGPGLHVLCRRPDLTILDVIWPPAMTLYPHDHRMWAAIGIYGGREDNAFYRRDGAALVSSGGRQVAEGTVLLLGDDVIHSVHNPSPSTYTGAIHIYGGDFVGTPRSQWDPESLTEQPYDLAAVRQEFDRAEATFRSS